MSVQDSGARDYSHRLHTVAGTRRHLTLLPNLARLPSRPDGNPTSVTRPRVLLVLPNRDLRLACIWALRRAELDVIPTATASDSLRILAKARPDGVVLAWPLREVDSWRIAMFIRAVAPDARLIALAGTPRPTPSPAHWCDAVVQVENTDRQTIVADLVSVMLRSTSLDTGGIIVRHSQTRSGVSTLHHDAGD